MLQCFVMPFKEDGRMEYAREYLEEKGFEYTQDKTKADFAVLPIPAKSRMLEGLDGLTVFYGAGDFNGYDYAKREDFTLANAYLTSESAIALFEESSDKALYNCEALIIGYGRIARSLHSILNSCGAKVTVCSRSPESRVEALKNNANHIGFDELKIRNSFDVIFNTVPHLVISKPELDAIREDALIIDLSSFPGGVDTLYAKSKGINLIDGKRLPSRYCKKTAGRLIGKAVFDIIKEEKV